MVSLQTDYRPNIRVVERKTDAHLITEVVTTREGLDRMAGDWNELLCESEADTIFLTWEWVSTWLDTVYPDARLFVVAVRDGRHQLIGVAPLYLSSMRAFNLLPFKCLRVLGDSQSGAEYGDLIIREGWGQPAMKAIASCLADARQEWDCLWLSSVAGWTGARDRWAALLERLDANQQWRPLDFTRIPLPDTHSEYLAQLRGKSRRQLGRLGRRLGATGKVEFRQCHEEAELSARLATLYDLHTRRWQSLGQEGSFARRPKLVEFNNQFSSLALSRGWLRLCTLHVADRPVAAVFGVAREDARYGLQTGFDPKVDGAGLLLWGEVMREMIGEGAAEFDFLRGSYDYKRYLGGEPRTGYEVFAGRRSLRNHLVFGLGLWVKGRCMCQGPPESFGCGHA